MVTVPRNMFLPAWVVAFLVLSVNPSYAQTQDIHGQWLLDVQATVAAMPSGVRSTFDALDETARQRMISAMNERKFHFLDNGDLTVEWKDLQGSRKSTEGTWKVNAGERILELSVGPEKIEYNFEFRSSSALILRAKVQDGFFANLVLERQY